MRMRLIERSTATTITTRAFARVVICVLLAICGAALCVVAQSSPAAQGAAAGAPVLLDNKPVFNIPWGFGNNTPTARANGTSRRLKELAESGTPIAMTQQAGELAIDIRCGNVILVSVYAGDAQAENTTADLLAKQWSDSMADAAQDYRVKYGWRQAFYRSGLSLLGIAMCISAYLWIRRRGQKIKAAAAAFLASHAAENTRVRVASRLSYSLREMFLQRLLGFLQFVLIVAAAVLTIHALLILFPATRPLAIDIYAGVSRFAGSFFHSFWANLPALIFILILAILLSQFIRIIRFFFSKVGEKSITIEGFRPSWASVTGRLVNIAVVVLAVLIAYPYVPGSQSAAFKGISLFLGVLLSLGSTGLVANVITGVMLTYMDAFETGDLVKIGEITAYVQSTSLLTTRLITQRNEVITVPNSFILDKQIVNYSSHAAGPESTLITTTVGMGYDVPWRQVEAMLIEAARRTESTLPEPAPFVVVPGFGEFSVNYELNAYLRPEIRRYMGITELNHNVMDVFNEYGVSIMTPAYRADPASPKVVAQEHLFDAPGTREQTPKPPKRKYPPSAL